MLERYVKTAQNNLRKVAVILNTDQVERLPIFLLAWRAAKHEITSMPANPVFGRLLHPPCDLLFRALSPPNMAQAIIDHMVYLMDSLHDIHYHICQHMKMATGWMNEGPLWLSGQFQRIPERRPSPAVIPNSGMSPELQLFWEGT